jgi:hypothetical protein
MHSSPTLDAAVVLSHWGVIRAQGSDAATFLHGQLTQDVAHLDASHARLAGYCSPKGRLLASFVIWSPRAGEVLLACHASVLAATLKRLSMFVMRAQCRLTDASADVCLVGVMGQGARDATSGMADWGRRVDAEGVDWIKLPEVHGVTRAWQVHTSSAAPTCAPSQVESALDAWRCMEVDSGIAIIESSTTDAFVPQMLNFELIGAVNFQKGCYPGQEVVARSQYRGTAKRRTFLFDCPEPLAAGDDVFHAEDASQPAGKVVVACRAPVDSASGLHHALVEVKLAAMRHGSLHVGTVDGPRLVQRTLPYAVPVIEESGLASTP